MASEPETRTANTTAGRIQLVGEWLEYLSGAQEGGFIAFQSATGRFVQFELDRIAQTVLVVVGTLEWQEELAGAIPVRAEERLVRKEFNAPDKDHLNYWQGIDRFPSTSLSSMAEWVFRDVFEEPADLRLSVAMIGGVAKQPEVQHLSQPQTGAGALEGAEYMGFWIRLAAQILDGIAVVAAVIVLFVVPNFFPPLAFLIIPAFFYGLYKHMKCQTLGRRLVGIEVVDESGEAISLCTGVLRETIGKGISDLVFGAGYIGVALDERKQGWHDKIASTYVVRRKRRAG